MRNKSSLLVACSLAAIGFAQAQFTIPTFDVELKAGACELVPKEQGAFSEYRGILASAGINFHLGQRIALGGFYSRSMSTKANGSYDNAFGDNVTYPAAHQTYGISVRLSTGRKPRFRPYVQASIARHEMYVDFDSYRIANSTLAIGGALGLMTRLSSKLYLILPELTLRKRMEGFYYETSRELLFEYKAGICYNFSKRK
jgi:hypothetical protein